MAAGEKPKITWGAAFANTLELGYPLDRATPYPQPREGSQWAKSPGGVEDSWVTETDELLAAVARWIPHTTGTTPEGTPITGWDGATGFAAFLRWGRAKNLIRFYPLRTEGTYVACYLVEPMKGAPAPENDGTRQVALVLRTSDDSAFTGF